MNSKIPRNSNVVPMMKRYSSHTFHDKRNERGGAKNTQSDIMNECDGTELSVSFEETKVQLESIEKRLSKLLGLQGDVRKHLISLDKNNKLVEDEIVADWHELLIVYMDWMRTHECSMIIDGTFILCGEGQNYCSDICMLRSKETYE